MFSNLYRTTRWYGPTLGIARLWPSWRTRGTSWSTTSAASRRYVSCVSHVYTDWTFIVSKALLPVVCTRYPASPRPRMTTHQLMPSWFRRTNTVWWNCATSPVLPCPRSGSGFSGPHIVLDSSYWRIALLHLRTSSNSSRSSCPTRTCSPCYRKRWRKSCHGISFRNPLSGCGW